MRSSEVFAFLSLLLLYPSLLKGIFICSILRHKNVFIYSKFEKKSLILIVYFPVKGWKKCGLFGKKSNNFLEQRRANLDTELKK